MKLSVMFLIFLFSFIFTLTFDLCSSSRVKYHPTWNSLDARPLPSWFDEAKVGIFIHWGVYSVPSFGSEWFLWNWKGKKESSYVEFMSRNYPPKFTYVEFAKQFTAEFYDPEEWVKLFVKAGARYVVLTSKHHEGYALFPFNRSINWNSVDVGPHRDLVGDLSSAVRKSNLRFGLYHSHFEWFNKIYNEDEENQFRTQNFVFEKSYPGFVQIVNEYKPDIVWSDGDGLAPDTYWRSKEFLAWLYNDSPVRDTVVVNDRWGNGTSCKHGGYYSCSDRYNPGTLQLHKWENCMTLDRHSWGYRRNAQIEDYLSMDELTDTLVETISCGGNILINVGPTKDGMIGLIYQERLVQLGSWLKVNGEAVYSSKTWKHQNDTLTPRVWYTSRPDLEGKPIYAFVLDWPKNGKVKLGSPITTQDTKVTFLGHDAAASSQIEWSKVIDSGIEVIFPNKAEFRSDWVWVIRITNTANIKP